jgi:tetratricopeptide (TPR) repeat protein
MTVNELVAQAGVFADGDKPDEAVEICTNVLLDTPDHPGALYCLGSVLLKAGRYAWATQIAKRITQVCPKDQRGWAMLSHIYGERSMYDESIRYAQKALECVRADHTLADLAYAHVNAGNWEQGRKYALAALQIPPSPLHEQANTTAQVNLAYADLAMSNWADGFKGYRKTMRTKWRKERVYATADGKDTQEWEGESGAVVIVTGEQGLGDEIMAAGMIADISTERGGASSGRTLDCKAFVFDCDHRLAALFQRSFPQIVVSPTRREDAVRSPVAPTHHKTLFGLGELLRKSDADFHRLPFLIPNQEYVGMFRELFGGQKVIGLAWSGGLPRTGIEHRAAGLGSFLPLLQKGGAEFVSLQYKDDAAEVMQMERAHGIKIRRLPWVTQGPDMDLLAGLLAACDSVIGVHTSALHLASAVGTPATILTHRGSGWRYAPKELLWYPPTTTMFRKNKGESWRECVQRFVG